MYITKKLIQLIESDENLFNNAVIEANQSKSLEERAKGLSEILNSLADEEATPWLSWSLAEIVLETVNWEGIIKHFEGKEVRS